MLCCVVLCCIVLCGVVWCCIVLWCVVLFRVVLYCVVLYCILSLYVTRKAYFVLFEGTAPYNVFAVTASSPFDGLHVLDASY